MAIRIRNLSFGYGSRKVLQNIDLDIEEGRFTVVLGRNGSGKSTLFRIMTGFLKPQQGEVSIMGQPAKSLDDRRRARLLGFLPQHHRPVFPFLAEDVVLTGRASHVWLTPEKKDHDISRDAMDRIGIGHLTGRIFTELSGGEQQLVMIARVLAQKPRIILFDEPTSHLDFFYQDRVLKIIRDLVNQNFTVAAILHDPNIAGRYGDRFICLKNGNLLPLPEKDRLDARLLEGVYGMPLEEVAVGQKTFVMPADG